MKILKRNYEHRNLLVFIVLSQVYLQTIYSLSNGISIISAESIRSFFSNHYFIFSFGILTMLIVMKVKKYSDMFLLIFLCLVAGKNFILLASSFNKMILVLNFAYLVFAFYFYMSWDGEITKACFNPLFASNDLEKSSRFALKGSIYDSNDQLLSEITVSNIDDKSCFVILDTAIAPASLKNMELKLVSNLEGVEFVSLAKLATVYDQGVGFEILSKKINNRHEWSELYKVCLERGLFT